jgi:hypothetical protein
MQLDVRVLCLSVGEPDLLGQVCENILQNLLIQQLCKIKTEAIVVVLVPGLCDPLNLRASHQARVLDHLPVLVTL